MGMNGGISLPSRSGDGRPTRTAAQIAEKVDVLALTVGTKLSASALLLAGVIVVLLGAQSLLGSLKSMDKDIAEMNKQMDVANSGLVVLNKTMTSVEPMANSMHAIVKTIDATGGEVNKSAKTIGSMSKTTTNLRTGLEGIAGSTTKMRTSYETMGDDTVTLSQTISGLNGQITPLAKTQHDMFVGTSQMRGGLDTMNDSLAYVIRVLNYITAPPSGQDLKLRVELPKEVMPPIPGVRAEVDPVSVFPRLSWPVFQG
jgi:hypothetical protein